jgi:hypothetical protein
VTSEPCDCALNESEHAWSVDEELSRAGDTDTSRFWVAGAHQVWWVRTKQGQLALGMPRVREILAEAENTIIESNSVVKFLRPDLYIQVLDPDTADFKDSAREFLDRADALIMHQSDGPKWDRVSMRPVAGKPVFRITPPEYVTRELVEFVRERIAHPITSRS